MADENGVWIGDHNPTLDPNDPFEKVLIEMVNLSRRKAHDYAADNDRFSNFRETADHMGLEPVDSCDLLIATKQARLKQLRQKGDPANESIRDTYIDRAVYSVIAVALKDEEQYSGMRAVVYGQGGRLVSDTDIVVGHMQDGSSITTPITEEPPF